MIPASTHFRILAVLLFFAAATTGSASIPAAPASGAELPDTAPSTELSSAEDALLEGNLEEAVGLLQKAARGPDREKALYRLGSCLLHTGRAQEALTALDSCLAEYRGGTFFNKVRFLKARALDVLRRYEDASLIYGEEISRLLSKERKEEVARFYIKYAGSLADPEREGGPEYKKAVELYRLALDLEVPEPLDQDLRLKIADLFHEMKQYQEEDDALSRFKILYPDSNMKDEVDYRIGDARLERGRLPEARNAFRGFLRDHPESTRVPDAHRGIARTYHMPEPLNEQELTLGIKALEDFLAIAPKSEKAPWVHYDVGKAYCHLGRYDEAVAAYEKLLTKYEGKPGIDVLPDVRFHMGDALLKQRRFSKALSAFNTFLVEHPSHHLWDDAQRLIVDTEFARCIDLMKEKKYGEARDAFGTFCMKHPLDSRAPDAYFALGVLEKDRKNFKAAVSDWKRLVSKYPKTHRGSEAQFMIGRLYETELMDLEAALEAYKNVSGDYRAEANMRIAAMKAKSLKVVIERAFTTSEPAKVKITTRNIESLSFRAYKVNLEDYFLKHLNTSRVESLDIDLIQPDEKWESAIEKYKEYAEITREEELPFEEPGAYILNVSDKERSATVLALITDLQMIVKSGREDVLVFVENVRTQEPLDGARILVSDGCKMLFQGKTGEDGVFLKADESLKTLSALKVLVAADNGFASNELGLADISVAKGLTPKAYLFTDRTVYRPGSEVRLKGFVREAEKGCYFFENDASYSLILLSPAGAEILIRKVTLDHFGAFDTKVAIDSSAPTGSYRFMLKAPTGWSQQVTFPVMKYTKPKAEITLDIPRDVFYPGETIEGTFKVLYSYGEPVVDKMLRYGYGTGVTMEEETDENGEVDFSIDSRDFAESGVYPLVAELPAENATLLKTFHFSTTGFSLKAVPSREVLLAGETLTVEVKASDPGAKPCEAEAELRVIRLVEEEGMTFEREIERIPVAITKDSGSGTAKVTLDKGGSYRFRAAAADRFGNMITADCEAFVSGESDEKKLRIFMDDVALDAGTSVEAGVHLRCPENLVLLTREGERIFGYEIRRLHEGMNKIDIDIKDQLAPNFTYAAAVMDSHHFHKARIDLKVRSSLKVELEPEKKVALPGEKVGLNVKITDRTGKPVKGQVAVALVDSALLSSFPDESTPIHEFFFGRERKGRMKTDSSCTFAFEAKTVTIDRAVIEEMGRRERGLMAGMALDFEADEDSLVMEEFESILDAPNVAGFAKLLETQSHELRPGPGGPTSPGPARPRGATTGGMARKRSSFAVGKEDLDQEVLQQLKSLGYNGGGGARHKDAKLNKSIGLGGGAGGTFRGRFNGKAVSGSAGFLAGRGRKESQGSAVPDETRKRFLETAFWNPSVFTGADGSATIEIELPDNITKWTVLAKGLDRDAAGGQGMAELSVRKKLFAFLECPQLLVEGDTAIFRANVVNSSEEKAEAGVTLELKGACGSKELTDELQIEPGAKGIIEFEIKAEKPGTINAALAVEASGLKDSLKSSIEVIPYSIPVSAGMSGSEDAPAVIKVSLPEGKKYTHKTMEIVLGPTFSDFLLHLATRPGYSCCLPTVADTADRLLVNLYALDYSRRCGNTEQLRSSNIEHRIEASLAALILAQKKSGAFPWISDKYDSLLATGQALKAMSLASRLGFNVPEKHRVKAADWIKNLQRTLEGAEKIFCIHALSFEDKPDFTELNRFYRTRNSLSNSELAMLSLAFLGGDHADKASSLVRILLERGAFSGQSSGSRSKEKIVQTSAPWIEDDLFSLSVCVQALSLTEPGHPSLEKGIKELMKSLTCKWHSSHATSAAAGALSEYLSGASQEQANYELDVLVNGTLVKSLKVNAPSPVERIYVPEELISDRDNNVKFAFNGAGTYAWAVRITGYTPDIEAMPHDSAHPLYVYRKYLEAPLMYKGKEVPSGFNTVDLKSGEHTWDNKLKELNEGEVGIVHLRFRYYKHRYLHHALAVVDTLPSGCTVVDSGIKGDFSRYEKGDGTITFYLDSRNGRADITYPIFGAVPGRFRATPTVVRSVYDYNLYTHGQGFELKLNPRGYKKDTEYRMTPDELYHLGTWRFADGDLKGAKTVLDGFMSGFAPREKYLVEVGEKLFKIAFEQGDDKGLIRYFELLRERAPSLTLSFKETARVAAAYCNFGEHEQALQLFSMIAGASFGRESKVSGALEKQGEIEGAVEYMQDLILTYPDLPSVQNALFGLSQSVLEKAGAPWEMPRIPGKTRAEIIEQALGILKNFLVSHPSNPVCDEAAYSLISTYLDLERGEEVAGLCKVFRRRWPDSKLRSSMEYAEAFALFETGRYDEAGKLLGRVADRPERGLTPPEKDDRDLARYILGQIEHAGGKIEAALERYSQVKNKFDDAAEAMDYFTHKAVSLPEVSSFGTGEPVTFELTYRNMADVKLSVYKVDLMKLYLARKTLNNITDINLAGIEPLLAPEIALGSGKDYKEMKKKLDLPIEEKGAYLLVVQGDGASCSGMVLVTDLEIEVQEDELSGRVRVNIKDAQKGTFEKNVYLKVIGSGNNEFMSGYTDLRGIFVAENVSGTSAVIADRDGEYAFHRGKTALQPETSPKLQQVDQKQHWKGADKRARALQNVFESNRQIQQRGQQLLDTLYLQGDDGVQIK